MVPPPPSPLSPTSRFSPKSRYCHVSLPDPVEELISRICTDQSLRPPDELARSKLAGVGELASMQILGVIASSRVRVCNCSAYIMSLVKNYEIAMAQDAEGLSTRQSSCFSGPSLEDDSDASSVDWEMLEREWEQELTMLNQEIVTGDKVVNSPPTVVSTDPSRFGAIAARNGKTVRRRLELDITHAKIPNCDNNCESSNPWTVDPSRERIPSPQMKSLGNLEFRRAFLILSYLGRAKLEDTVSMELLEELKYMSMEEFELHIWKEFGIKNIKASDRRKIVDWDMSKTHVYHCHVNIEGHVTFKGPFLESTKTHLQRVLGDENILHVKFEEIRQEEKTPFDFDNYCDVYHRVAEQGIELGLRRYRHLGMHGRGLQSLTSLAFFNFVQDAQAPN